MKIKNMNLGITQQILNVFYDGERHTVGDIEKRMRELGFLDATQKNTSVRNSLHRLKKNGDIISVAKGVYLWNSEKKTSDSREINTNIEKLKEIKEILFKEFSKIQQFNWLSCSEEELLEVKEKARILMDIVSHLEKIKKLY